MRFNFNVFFSLLYLLTFYFGFPLTCLLVFQFDVEVVPVEFLLYALLSATAFYAIYYVTYKTRLRKRRSQPRATLFTMNRVETHMTWCFWPWWRSGPWHLLHAERLPAVQAQFLQPDLLQRRVRRGAQTVLLLLHSGDAGGLFPAAGSCAPGSCSWWRRWRSAF